MIGGQNQPETTLISAGIGAIVGGVASYIIQGSLDKRDVKIRRDTLFNLEGHGITRPTATNADLSDVGGLLTSPEVSEEWVDTHTEGAKLIEGHRVWNIMNSPTWELSRKPERKKRK